MSENIKVLAIDFGASTGRVIKAEMTGDTLEFNEIHRFANTPYMSGDTLCWDLGALLAEVKKGISMAGHFDSLGFDTWGVDFGLLDDNGRLMGDPVHYRDTRTDSYPDKAFSIMDKNTLYAHTGVQLMQLNTLFQLLAIKEQQPKLMAQAKTLLFMPDLFAYMLGAKPSCELTIASTSQMLDPVTKNWNPAVLREFDISTSLLLTPVHCGTVTGELVGGEKIIAVAGHDTQCAIAALPVEDSRTTAFLSCGTWSLLGTELDAPVLTPQSCALDFSNELGANGKINYLTNITGLWLIQESRREWQRQGKQYSYAELESLAKQAAPLRSFINPNSREFAGPGDIPNRVREFCRSTCQPIPESVGEIMRCLYDSLALAYRQGTETMKAVTGKQFKTLHMLGGGVRDKLLCKLSADATGLPVIAGPIEATALGNIIIQLKAMGALSSLDEGRAFIARTQLLEQYFPSDTKQWEEAYSKYKTILKKGER